MDHIAVVAAALLLSFVNTGVIHTIKMRFPKFYFSLGQLVVTEKEDITIGGLVTKFGPPFVISLLLGLFRGTSALELTLLYAFFASFLVVWPVVLSGNELLSWEAKKKINVLYLIYFFYILSYEAFAFLGYWIGIGLRGVEVRDWSFGLIAAYPSWSPLIQSVVSNLISGAIIALVGAVFTLIYRRLFRILWNRINQDRKKFEDLK